MLQPRLLFIESRAWVKIDVCKQRRDGCAIVWEGAGFENGLARPVAVREHAELIKPQLLHPRGGIVRRKPGGKIFLREPVVEGPQLPCRQRGAASKLPKERRVGHRAAPQHHGVQGRVAGIEEIPVRFCTCRPGRGHGR